LLPYCAAVDRCAVFHLSCRHLQRNPDNQLYPLFEYFENWCQDENRHGDFFTAILKVGRASRLAAVQPQRLGSAQQATAKKAGCSYTSIQGSEGWQEIPLQPVAQTAANSNQPAHSCSSSTATQAAATLIGNGRLALSSAVAGTCKWL
jgi:hypothetical protein